MSNQIRQWATRAVALTALSSMVFVQSAALADPIGTGASQGQAAAKALYPDPTKLFSTDGNGNITLWPGTPNQSSITTQQLYQAPAGSSAGNLTSLYGNNGAMIGAGLNAQQTLDKSNTIPGQAYQTVFGSSQLSRPDLSKDPMFTQTDNVLSNLNTIAQTMGDCSTSSTISQGSQNVHMPDYKTCQIVNDYTAACNVAHAYTVSLFDASGFAQTACPGDKFCVRLVVGKVAATQNLGDLSSATDHNFQGIFDFSGTLTVTNPAALKSVVLAEADFDDYSQVLINGSKVWNDSSGQFPPESGTGGERNTHWTETPGLDLTRYFSGGQPGTIDQRVSVWGRGLGWAYVDVHYDPTKVVNDQGWTPQTCFNALQGIDDGFCTGTVTCTSAPANLDSNGCGTVNGLYVCPADFTPDTTAVTPLCYEAAVNASCQFYKGQMPCWTDPQGNQQCPYNDGGNLNSCTALQQQGCGFISSGCATGAMGDSGTCYVTEQEWDCGGDQSVPTYTRSPTQYTCAGPIRCMGSDCVTPPDEQSQDFGNAAAMLQAARFMAMDANCVSSSCAIFQGKPATCKKAVAGVVDCCNKPTGASLSNYITLIMAVGKLGSVVHTLDEDSAIRGAYETLSQPIEDAWSEVNKPFVEAWEDIWGGSTSNASDEVAKDLVGTVTQDLTNQVAQWTADTFGPDAANALFSTVDGGGEAFSTDPATGAVEEAGDVQLGGGAAIVGSALSFIGTAYAIYSITMAIINIIWKCETSEFTLDSEKDLKDCHYVGAFCKGPLCIESDSSYCCFNSPLSRILQEQIRPQLGISWGPPENPNCNGIQASDLSKVDWSKVDFSEWIGILSETGHFPTAANMNLDSITGTGSSLNAGPTPRQNAQVRAIGRVNDVVPSVGSVQQQTQQELFQQALPRQ